MSATAPRSRIIHNRVWLAMIEGSCLCGAVRFEIAEPPKSVTQCNCSACRRLGTLWAYYRPDQVRLLAAEGAIMAYGRGERSLAFHHCAVCGCTTHWSAADPGLDRMAVNARLMAPEVMAAAQVRHFDGAGKLKG
jgi:hypothetical protein